MSANPFQLSRPTRRTMLQQCSLGFGSLALAGLLADKSFGATAAAAKPPGPHFRPRAKRVILLYVGRRLAH